MFADMLGLDVHKYDLSSIEAGKKFKAYKDYVVKLLSESHVCPFL